MYNFYKNTFFLNPRAFTKLRLTTSLNVNWELDIIFLSYRNFIIYKLLKTIIKKISFSSMKMTKKIICHF